MEIKLSDERAADEHLLAMTVAAERARDWLKAHDGDPLELLKAVKFEAIGFHPVTGAPLNFIEQVNQTFTYIVALKASRELFRMHPGCGPLLLAPGAHAAQELDIMSDSVGLIGAETFSAVSPRNNGKLARDLDKLSKRPERFRYVFFASPMYPKTGRIENFERSGVQVWSVHL